MWRTSRQACLLCPWARHLTGRLHLYVADRWSTRTSPDYNCEVAYSACRKRRLLGTHQWQSALLVVGLPVTEDWFKMGCHLSPSLILIRLTACRTSIPRKRRGNHKQTNKHATKCVASRDLRKFERKSKKHNVSMWNHTTWKILLVFRFIIAL